MKILYIVPNINNEGGVARVLSIKANYLCEKLGYDVHILTQNQGNSPLFYSFNHKIVLHDMILSGTFFQFITSYRKALNNKIKAISPDIILVCDNGLKAYTIPFILKTKIPIVFESHGSIFIEEKKINKYQFLNQLKLLFKGYSVKEDRSIMNATFTLANEDLKEGDKIRIKLIGTDPKTGKFRLSHKVLLPKPEGYVEREERKPNKPTE